MAGAVFVVTIGPELGAIAVVAGVSAFVGSLILLGIDGAVFGTEISGREDLSHRIEGNEALQWARITATLMTLPDMAVGGVRALKEVGMLSGEAREASTAARAASDASQAQRARAAKIRNPAKHPGPVQKHLAKARRFAQQARDQVQVAERASRRARVVATRDVGASYLATPTGAALITASPPGVVLSEQQKKLDSQLLQHVAPEGGLPRDVRLDMRVSVLQRPGHR